MDVPASERPGPQNTGQADLSSASARERLVASVAAVVRVNNLFPEMGEKIAAALGKRLGKGAYDHAATADRTTRALTEDMRAISRDFHIGVIENRRIACLCSPVAIRFPAARCMPTS